MKSVLQKMDMEIEHFWANSQNQPTEYRIEKLGQYTAIRSQLSLIQWTAPCVDALYQCDSLLTMADCSLALHLQIVDRQPDYTAAVFWFVEDVYLRERMKLMRERVKQENEAFHNQLETLPDEEIICKACESTIKNEMVSILLNAELSVRQMDALMTYPHILDALYNEWSSGEYTQIRDLPVCIERAIEKRDHDLQVCPVLCEVNAEAAAIWNQMYDGEDWRVPEDNEEEEFEV